MLSLFREMLVFFSVVLFLKAPFVFAETETDPCLERVDPGPCQYYSVKWYWSQEDESCKEFHYGGCLGTKNRFNSKQQCMKQCVYKTHNPAVVPDACLLDSNPGLCNDDRNGLWFWYFNSDKGECEKFFYYGCGGNDNRFYSVYSCQKVCGERLAPRTACDRCDSRTSFCKQHSKYNYTCECLPGFTKDKHGECLDEDECRTFTATCDKNAWCQNTIGSYRCECKAGYRGDGKQCTYVGLGRSTIDCTKCHKDATCNHGVCECKVGFIGDGFNCSDVNECLSVPYVCDRNAECDNVPGSYICRCQPGYAGNGFNCTKSASACLDKYDRNYAEQCSGENWREHYYLDHDSKRCALLWYDGCRGTSRNIFSDLNTCEQMCEMTNVLTRSQICWDHFDVNYRNQCAQGNWEQRYYFDHASLSCKMFWYDQCRGTSRNLFDDLLTCQWQCEEQPIYKSKSCLEPFDEHYRGECNGGRWRKFYYYDKSQKICHSFWYDGCTGDSQNIYSDEMTCQSLCEDPAKLDPPQRPHHPYRIKNIDIVQSTHQSNSSLCDSEPCQNNGTCQVKEKGYDCLCAPGFSGTNCSEKNELDPCAEKPCKNGGTCRSKNSKKTKDLAFECVCKPGFTGETCESRKSSQHTSQAASNKTSDPCDANPCFNNGTCATSKGLSSFYCNCPSGFAGKLCDIVIGETKPKQNSMVSMPASDKVAWMEQLKKDHAKAKSTVSPVKSSKSTTPKPTKGAAIDCGFLMKPCPSGDAKTKAKESPSNVMEALNSTSIALNDAEMEELGEPAAMKQEQADIEPDIKGTGGFLDGSNSCDTMVAIKLLQLINICCVLFCVNWL